MSLDEVDLLNLLLDSVEAARSAKRSGQDEVIIDDPLVDSADRETALRIIDGGLA